MNLRSANAAVQPRYEPGEQVVCCAREDEEGQRVTDFVLGRVDMESYAVAFGNIVAGELDTSI